MAGKFEITVGRSGKFSFSLRASNGQVVFSSEQYATKKAAQNGVKSVQKNAANEKRFEVRDAKDGRTYFVLKATNGEIIGKSQLYKEARSLRKGIASVQRFAAEAAVVDLTA